MKLVTKNRGMLSSVVASILPLACVAFGLVGCAQKSEPIVKKAVQYKQIVQEGNQLLDQLQALPPDQRAKFIDSHAQRFSMIQMGAFPDQTERLIQIMKNRVRG